MLYCFQIFFLIIDTSKHSTLTHQSQFCEKRCYSCEIRCPVFTSSHLSIAGVIMGHIHFLTRLLVSVGHMRDDYFQQVCLSRTTENKVLKNSFLFDFCVILTVKFFVI